MMNSLQSHLYQSRALYDNSQPKCLHVVLQSQKMLTAFIPQSTPEWLEALTIVSLKHDAHLVSDISGNEHVVHIQKTF
jgi:hypothetical protein